MNKMKRSLYIGCAFAAVVCVAVSNVEGCGDGEAHETGDAFSDT